MSNWNCAGGHAVALGLFYLPLVPVYRASVKINRLIDLDRPVRLLGLGGNHSVVHGRGDGFCNLFVIGYRRPAADRTDHFRVARLVCYKQLAGSGEAAGGKTGNVAFVRWCVRYRVLPVIFTLDIVFEKSDNILFKAVRQRLVKVSIDEMSVFNKFLNPIVSEFPF